ncbi:MAG: hypothetical protein NTZ78_02535 [Candidatus Aureabacteria bacterium]|nr:hypothetical protein [Candidatus Auribacterota bacterium]
MSKDTPKKLDREQLRKFIHVNPDARQYFYSKADNRWLDWLWQNGFLDVIKEKAKDPIQYGYGTPELNYLVRMAEKAPAKVVDIMVNVPISSETFNPVVIVVFLHICSILPADQLARVVEKIRNERWIPLMGAFNQWRFDYEKMFKLLSDARDYKSLLVLVEAVLAIRTKEELEKTPRRGFDDNPFYFDDLSCTEVFKHLANVSDKFAEQALAVATKAMTEVIALWSEEDEGECKKIFKVYDEYMLSDVDFFSLELGQKDRLSTKDDVRELISVITVLAEHLIGKRCDESEYVRNVYNIYIDTLPDSRAMWRLRLFILSLCPEVFKDKLKKALFRLFEVERYDEIMSGTEYKKALQKSFAVLSNKDKRDYVKRVVEYFARKDQEKEDAKENWYIHDGSQILSMIVSQLTREEKQGAEEVGFRLDPNYKPEPRMRMMHGGAVVPRGPIAQEEFGKLPIAEIAKKLRNEWAPEKLAEQNTSDDLLSPLNAEGVGKLLRNDIPKRLQEYVENAGNFFERGVLDQHYTYSYLSGIQETIKNHRETASKLNWDGVMDLYIAIKASGEKNLFEREKRERNSFNAWLAGWDAVHSAMTDILQESLTKKDGLALVDFSRYRNLILNILSYLLSYPDPAPEDEQIKTAKSKTKSPGDADFMVSDPYDMAINTVRGRAFKAFVLFAYQDGKKFKKEDKAKISDDVKDLYEGVLSKENTRALMFMFGHYLPTLYFRDKDWIRELLPQMFPQESAKKCLYTAAWEGYLASDLYEEIFFEPEIQKLYARGLALTDAEYPKQKHSIEPDEGIAVHLALAFMHYKKFGVGHSLFNEFRKKNDPEQHAYFVNFLGRSFISGNDANANELLDKEPESKKRLRDFWDWMIENYKAPKPFIEFGHWINLEKEIFEPAWLAERVKKTLKKTKGALDWDYGLIKSIVRLAQQAPTDTLEIARQYLLEGCVRGGGHRRPMHLDNEWTEALKVLYENPKAKSGTYALIDELIREGRSAFWNLKEIVDNNS